MTSGGKENGGFRVGDWYVDPDRLKIRREGEPEQQLTPRAMAVLVALAEAEGRVAHKNDLLDRVWPHAEVTQGVLSQAILELRSAVGDQPQAPHFIETVRGRGFRLIPNVSWNPPGTTLNFDRASGEPVGRWRLRGWPAAFLIVLIVAVGYLLMQANSEPPIPAEPTLLVVPFEDLSEKGDHEHLARGMAEEIAVRLSAAPELRLLSNRMFSPYLAQADEPLALAREYGVDLILTGSVQPQNERIKLVAELADTRSAEQLWVSSYNRPKEDIYVIQNEVAQSIADLLLERDLVPRSSPPTTSLRAYDYYLRGRWYLSDVNPRDTSQAVELFEQALHLDADYAPAVASLATALAMQGFLYQQGPEKLAAALEKSNEAIGLNPDLADAHYARALALMGKGQFSASRAAIEKAAGLSPSHVDAVFLAGALSDGRGDWRAAVNHYRRALELNPRLPRTVALGRLLYLLGDEEAALSVARRGVQLDPGPPGLYMAHLLTLMERHEEALAHCRVAVQMKVPRAKNLCGFSAFVAGERDLAEKWLSEDWAVAPRAQWGPFTFAASATHLAAVNLQVRQEAVAMQLLDESEALALAALEAGNDHWALRYNLAAVAALRGNGDRAMQWLRASYENGFRDHRLLALDPALAGVRNDPEFKRLQREIGFYALQAAEQLGVGES